MNPLQILHPFGEEPETPAAPRGPQSRGGGPAGYSSYLDSADDPLDITSSAVKNHSAFKRSADLVLRPHWGVADAVRDRLLGPNLQPEIAEAVEPHAEKLREALDLLQKNYRIYVETASNESLEKEASRLERRYFEKTGEPGQLRFLRLKRFYEKIRTFNEHAKRDWREVQKVIDNLSVLNDTRSLAYHLERQYLRSITLLIRQTESLLDDLRLYLEVQEESIDRITGSHKVTANYKADIRYSIGAMLGEPEEPDNAGPAQAEEGPRDWELESAAREREREEERKGSIAYNIVLETREHKLNRASIISTPLLGSRDWNRSPDYNMEAPIQYFEDCVEVFRDAYHVNLDTDNLLLGPLPPGAAQVRRGMGADVLGPYGEMVLELLNTAAIMILVDDFPGIEKPEVFLYHCGPNVFYRILLGELKQRGIGEMFHLDGNKQSVREFPEELLKKLLIDWWNERFDRLSGEEVDSYLTYSRQLEIVRREYRILYEEGVALRKREQPGANYLGVEKWLKENRNRVFGLRKVEIFKRFIPGTILESAT